MFLVGDHCLNIFNSFVLFYVFIRRIVVLISLMFFVNIIFDNVVFFFFFMFFDIVEGDGGAYTYRF